MSGLCTGDEIYMTEDEMGQSVETASSVGVRLWLWQCATHSAI